MQCVDHAYMYRNVSKRYGIACGTLMNTYVFSHVKSRLEKMAFFGNESLEEDTTPRNDLEHPRVEC